MVTHHSRQQKVHAHPANKKENNYLTALRRKFYARFTNVSREHTSHLSLWTKTVHAHPPLKKQIVDATGLPSQDLRELYKGELTTLRPLVTESKKAPSQLTPPKDKHKSSRKRYCRAFFLLYQRPDTKDFSCKNTKTTSTTITRCWKSTTTKSWPNGKSVRNFRSFQLLYVPPY